MSNTEPRECRVIIADGNADVRSALRCVVEQETSLTVAGEADNSRSLLRLLSSTEADILFLDAELPGASAAEQVHLLNWDHPGLAIILMNSDPGRGAGKPGARVCCYISKKDPPEAVLQALRIARTDCLST